MITNTQRLIASGFSMAFALFTTPAGAIDASEWLQNQISVDHHRALETISVGGMQPHGAHKDMRTSHGVAARWVARNLAGMHTYAPADDGVAGRAGPLLGASPDHSNAEAWIRRHLSTH